MNQAGGLLDRLVELKLPLPPGLPVVLRGPDQELVVGCRAEGDEPLARVREQVGTRAESRDSGDLRGQPGGFEPFPRPAVIVGAVHAAITGHDHLPVDHPGRPRAADADHVGPLRPAGGWVGGLRLHREGNVVEAAILEAQGWLERAAVVG